MRYYTQICPHKGIYIATLEVTFLVLKIITGDWQLDMTGGCEQHWLHCQHAYLSKMIFTHTGLIGVKVARGLIAQRNN